MIGLFKRHCQFANQGEEKFKMYCGNLLSLLGAQNEDTGAVLQMLLTGVRL